MPNLISVGGVAGAQASFSVDDTGALTVTDASGATILTLSAAGVLTPSGSIAANASTATKLASSSYFTSTVQTGTGSAQNIAHGLGVTPSVVIPFMTGASGSPNITLGTATSTNCVITAASGVTYQVVAIK